MDAVMDEATANRWCDAWELEATGLGLPRDAVYWDAGGSIGTGPGSVVSTRLRGALRARGTHGFYDRSSTNGWLRKA